MINFIQKSFIEQVGEPDQLIIENQEFAVATSMSWYLYDPADGIMGLGWTSIADGFVNTPLRNAYNLGLLPEPIFTVWMEHRV